MMDVLPLEKSSSTSSQESTPSIARKVRGTPSPPLAEVLFKLLSNACSTVLCGDVALD